ncbi:MAG TPA: hypothetical protein ENK70_02840, partial [Methylophaga sp.]|nr:hypothetical protein [Methylophaga sp.]
MKKKPAIIITLLLGIVLLFPSLSVQAENYSSYITITLEDSGTPITDEQTVRFSLWSDPIMVAGDVNSGVINTGAPNYTSYNIEITDTPNGSGEVTVNLEDLAAWPTITSSNQYMMIEYKDSGDPVTTYLRYQDEYMIDFYYDRTILLGDDGIFYSNDATASDDFILDDDDSTTNSGNNIVLQFGASLAETLLWDTSNTRFTLSDDLRIEGNAAIVGIGYIADNHSATDSDGTLSLGRDDSTWETLMWDDSDSKFEFTNDLDITGNITLTGTLDGRDVNADGTKLDGIETSADITD